MGCKPIRLTSAVLLGLVFRCQCGKHEGFVKYFLRLRSNGKEKRAIFCNFRQPPSTLHIHSSDRERTWPEAHCHVCDCRAFSTMICDDYPGCPSRSDSSDEMSELDDSEVDDISKDDDELLRLLGEEILRSPAGVREHEVSRIKQ